MEKSERLKAKLKGAMIYPLVVLFVAFVIVLALMYFIIPTFSEVLTDMSDGSASLPWLTAKLLGISNWLKGRNGLNILIILAVPLVIFVQIKLVRQFRAGRFASDWMKLHIPMVRRLVYATTVARWTRTLATLISAGVPILEALNITRETSENEIYSRMLGRVQQAIRQGDTFANPLRQSKTVDTIVVNMVDVGEETGDLDKMLDEYDRAVDDRRSRWCCWYDRTGDVPADGQND
jgi:type IV pilus assembly protein PilC